MDYPQDAAALRDEIRAWLRTAVADEGSSLDTGGGGGSADLWCWVGGKEYFISVASRPVELVFAKDSA